MSGERSGGRVLVALSGGVDSGVAAALLVEQGYDVVAAMLRLWVEDGPDDCSRNRWCTPDAVTRARNIAGRLDVPFYLINAEEVFEARVVDYFVAEYAVGRTPNPCVPCNRFIRFGFLLERALALGVDLLATGHYARVRDVGGAWQLLRGCDRAKDQSYFLHALSQQQLAHVLFPLGEMTKREVRGVARRHGLPVAEQAESQDLCFLADGDYRRFLARRRPGLSEPGSIRDTSGRVLGRHRGLYAYTVGQRKGLGVTAADPLYVIALDPDENVLIVGTQEDLEASECVIEGVRFVSGEAPAAVFTAMAQIRYRAQPVAAAVTLLPGGGAGVRFAFPQRAVTSGQYLALYDGETVLGGGVISESML
jgi:tRNA-specific 2-thiouridylase